MQWQELHAAAARRAQRAWAGSCGHLQGLGGLRHLGLFGMREVRGHLRRLRHLPLLRALRRVHSLTVDNASISERGLAELRAMPTLQRLNREELKRGLTP